MLILGIETSCDETAAGVVADGRHILSNVVASQVELHARYGGVVPEVASRQHLLAFLPTVRRALSEAGVSGAGLGAVAVTAGPGLPGSLLAGVNGAKALALGWGLPLVGVNHLEAHLYAHWLSEMPLRDGPKDSPWGRPKVPTLGPSGGPSAPAESRRSGAGLLRRARQSGHAGEGEPPEFPVVALIVSGGHTELVLMRDHGRYSPLGRTLDDAAGEAFDKVARLLGLGYPGGPAIERAAQGVRPYPPLPRPWLRGTHSFSFSGLKTAVLRLVQSGAVPQDGTAALAASFQEAVVEVLVAKTVAAAQKHRARAVLVAGGVAANRRLREVFRERSPLTVCFPPPVLCGDNGAIVAACGFYQLQRSGPDPWDLDIRPGWRLE